MHKKISLWIAGIRTQQSPLMIGLIVFLIIAIILIAIGSVLAMRARNQRITAQNQSFQAPTTTNKREIKQIRVSRINQETGEEEYLEINANGQVNLYNKDNQLIQKDLQGYSRINLLFNKINRYLSSVPESDLESLLSSGNNTSIQEIGDQCVIFVSTNLGDFLIPCDEVPDITDDIEDIEEETFYPTPTPTLLPTIALPSPTPIPGTPTPTSPPPTITPGGPSPTPTPIPDYMTAPPFSCDQYDSLGRPVAISNVICGVD